MYTVGQVINFPNCSCIMTHVFPLQITWHCVSVSMHKWTIHACIFIHHMTTPWRYLVLPSWHFLSSFPTMLKHTMSCKFSLVLWLKRIGEYRDKASITHGRIKCTIRERKGYSWLSSLNYAWKPSCHHSPIVLYRDHVTRPSLVLCTKVNRSCKHW